MTLHGWIAFVPVAIAVSALPGPAFLTVVSAGARFGFRASLAANAGVLVGDTIYFTIAACGLGTILATSQVAFEAVKILGAAYLTWLALRALFGSRHEPLDAVKLGPRVFRTALGT